MRSYEPADEVGWVRCRVLSFLGSAFWDDGELRLVKAFAHDTGDRPEEIRPRYARVHDDVLYEKRL